MRRFYILFLLFWVAHLCFAQNQRIFVSDYLPVARGRTVAVKIQTQDSIRLAIDDSSIARLRGNFVKGLKSGKTMLRAYPINSNGTDSIEVVVTEWLSGISSLVITDSVKDFYVNSVIQDTILGYFTTTGLSRRKLVHFDKDLQNKGELHQFDAQPLEILKTPDCVLLLEQRVNQNTPKKIYRSTDLINWECVHDSFPNRWVRPPDSYVTHQGWCSDSSGNIYLGEYLTEDSLFSTYSLSILKSTDKGRVWKSVYSFPSRNVTGAEGGIRHIHTIAYDAQQGYVWLSTGDASAQSRIYYHPNKLLPDSDGVVRLNLVGTNQGEDFRAISFIFGKDYIYWLMDSPALPQKVFRIPRMPIYPRITQANNYAQLTGTLKDKAFWYSLPIRFQTDSGYLAETAYEKPYPPLLDKRSRLFVFQDKQDLHYQEVYAAASYALYSHLYARGQLSDGSIVLGGQSNIHPGYYLFKARLRWTDVFSEAVRRTGTGDSLAAATFPALGVTLAGTSAASGKIVGFRPLTTNYPMALPDSVQLVGSHYYEFFSDSVHLQNGQISITLQQQMNGCEEQRLLYYDRETGQWLDLGAVINNDVLTNLQSFKELGWFAVVKPRRAFKSIPITISEFSSALNSKTLFVGIDSTASDSIDLVLNENGQGAFPQAGNFEARFILPRNGFSGTLTSYRDYRYGSATFCGTIEHRIRYQPSTDTGTITIAWDLPNDVTGQLKDVATDGMIVNVPLAGTGSYTVSDPDSLDQLKLFLDYHLDNMYFLIRAIPEAYYLPQNQQLSISDTFTVYLASAMEPYDYLDSAKIILDSITFSGTAAFKNAPAGQYYLVLKGRKTIESWSGAGGLSCSKGNTNRYAFDSLSIQTYGANAKLIDGRWCIFSGDVNQDGFVDFSDMLEIDNAQSSFLMGYNAADLTGDNFVDYSDLRVCENNALHYVGTKKPGGNAGRSRNR